MTTNNRCIRTDGSTFFNQGFIILALSYYGTSRVFYIRKNHGWSQENLIFTDHSLVDRYIVLYFNIISKYYIIGNKNILSKIAIFTEHTAPHDMAKMPNLRPFPYAGSLINNGAIMWEIIFFHALNN